MAIKKFIYKKLVESQVPYLIYRLMAGEQDLRLELMEGVVYDAVDTVGDYITLRSSGGHK